MNRCAEERPAVDSHPGDSHNETPGPVTGGPGFKSRRADCKLATTTVVKIRISPITRISKVETVYSMQSEVALNTALFGRLVAGGRLGVGSASPAVVKDREGHARDPRLGVPGLSPAFSPAVVELRRLSRRREPRQLLSTEISTAGDA